MSRKAIITSLTVLALLVGFGADRAGAHQILSSDLLLPYFEVDLTGYGLTTYASIVNSSDETVPVRMTVYSNWGIQLLSAAVVLEAHEVNVVNLNQWILSGQLPDKALTKGELEHLQAALSGQRSPQDDLYYGTELALNLAVGYLTIRVDGSPRPDVLFGDYFIVDPASDFAQGEVLVNIDRTVDCEGLCVRHGLRFLDGGGFDGGTDVIIWTRRVGQPSETPYLAENRKVVADVLAYREDGEEIDHRQLDLLPLAVVKVSELGLSDPFGWFDFFTEEESFIGVRYSALSRFSVALQTVCMPLEPPEPTPRPRIRIEKSTNGEDADVAPGPTIAVGAPVVWEYVVTNRGNVGLTDVVVTDDQGVAVSCPESTLSVGASMTCTATGAAVAGQYANVGTVTGWTPDGEEVEDSDPSHYFGGGLKAAISIEKATNGEDADDPQGPTLVVGDPVAWTYVVTNTGEVELSNVTVTDDKGVQVTCPKSTLAVGESMTCTGSGTAELGQYGNVGTAIGRAPDDEEVEASDPSHYFGVDRCGGAAISIEKATNGHDADSAPGPTLFVGDAVDWTYVVTNTGEVALDNVTVTDDMGVQVSCPKTSLAVGESMTCTGSGFAIAGQYSNVGTATDTVCGPPVQDSDPSHYYGIHDPKIGIEKATNGHDADSAPGPYVIAGDPVTWTYEVTNLGPVALHNVTVSDDRGVAVSCPKSTLAAGESMTCTGSGIAVLGQYANVGTATGTSPDGVTVSDSDPSHYYGEIPPGDQGCTPGYWKNHTDSWPPTGLSPSQTVVSVFAQAAAYPNLASTSLHQALDFDGGDGVEGAARILLRAAVASLLNASHSGVSYPRTAFVVVGDVNDALASGSRDAMLGLASALDRDNNLGCPLN
jgi:uncharacterized repeat protein (TIGR01451 family)